MLTWLQWQIDKRTGVRPFITDFENMVQYLKRLIVLTSFVKFSPVIMNSKISFLLINYSMPNISALPVSIGIKNHSVKIGD